MTATKRVARAEASAITPEKQAELLELYAARGVRIVELAREDPVLGPAITQIEAALPAFQGPLKLLNLDVPGSLDDANPVVVALLTQAIARTWTASE